MNLLYNFNEINWISVIVATAASFVIGGLWYSPILFGKKWQSLIKISDEEIKNSNMPVIFGLTFVLSFIGSFALALFIGKEATIFRGILAGLFVSIAWIATTFGTSYLFTRKSLSLFLIDAGYYVVFYMVMGAIIGVF